MSGLAAVLAGQRPPGVYAWRAAFDVTDVRHTVEHAGWCFAALDGAALETRSELLAELGTVLGLPEWYGANFDALSDLLGDVGTSSAGCLLLWDAWAPLARADKAAFNTALEVFEVRARAEGRPSFTVLLRGEGPVVPGLRLLE